MENRNVLIVTGMDRSGTSWVASAIRASGVFMGERLFKAARGNPFGHFEDEDFLNFHIDLLKEVNYEGLYKYGSPDTPPVEIHVPEEYVQRALKLIENRNECVLWGFKDPRTVLFLDFWKQLVPDIKVICLYRHPLEMCISLFSRGDGFADLGGVFRAFQHRMGKALAFKQDNPEQMLLCNIHQVIAAPDQLEQMIYQHLKVSIERLAATLRQSFVPQAFTNISASTGTLINFYQLFPEAAHLFERLEELADMPGSAEFGKMSLSAAREVSQKAPSPALDDQQIFENLQLEFFSSLVEDGLAVEDVRKRIIVGLLENIKMIGGVNEVIHNQKDWIEKQDEHIRSQKDWIEKQDEVIRNQKDWIERLEVDAQILAAIRNSLTWRIGQRLAFSPLGRAAHSFLRLLQRWEQTRRKTLDKETNTAMEIEMDRQSGQPDAPRSFFQADLPPGELEHILRRIEENLSFRQILKSQALGICEDTYTLPQLPAMTEIDRRLQYLRALRAPLFGPVSGFLLSLVCHVLNLPIRLFGRKQIMFNEELLALMYDLVALLHVLSEHSLILSSWGKDIEQIQNTLQEIQDTQQQLQADLQELKEKLATSPARENQVR